MDTQHVCQMMGGDGEMVELLLSQVGQSDGHCHDLQLAERCIYRPTVTSPPTLGFDLLWRHAGPDGLCGAPPAQAVQPKPAA